MNQRNIRFTHAVAHAAAAVAVVAMMALAATPAMAATDPGKARIETRIKDMHTKLKITAAEEEQWAKVADVMRDNANKMDDPAATDGESQPRPSRIRRLKFLGHHLGKTLPTDSNLR